MNLDTARQLISGMDVERFELRDHAFGDAEVTWMRDGKDIAFGYFGSKSEVQIGNTHFGDKDANFLRQFGTPKFSRNDETGPDDYKEGKSEAWADVRRCKTGVGGSQNT